MATKMCAKCGDTFTPTGNRQKYCSVDCKKGRAGGGPSVPASKAVPAKRAARKAPRPTAPIGDAQLDAAAVLRALGWDVHELGTANGRKVLAVGAGS